jgi:hypothetical protein
MVLYTLSLTCEQLSKMVLELYRWSPPRAYWNLDMLSVHGEQVSKICAGERVQVTVESTRCCLCTLRPCELLSAMASKEKLLFTVESMQSRSNALVNLKASI